MKLQLLLSEYLYENGDLPLAAVGRLSVQHTVAQFSDDLTTLMPPLDELIFQQDENESEDENLVQFISERLQVSVDQAHTLVEQEGNFKSAIATVDTYNWPALGTFKRGEDGKLFLKQENILQQYLPTIALVPAPLQKEDEKTETIAATDIEEAAQEVAVEPLEDWDEPVQQSRWWIAAVIIFAVSAILILIRYLAGA